MDSLITWKDCQRMDGEDMISRCHRVFMLRNPRHFFLSLLFSFHGNGHRVRASRFFVGFFCRENECVIGERTRQIGWGPLLQKDTNKIQKWGHPPGLNGQIYCPLVFTIIIIIILLNAQNHYFLFFISSLFTFSVNNVQNHLIISLFFSFSSS